MKKAPYCTIHLCNLSQDGPSWLNHKEGICGFIGDVYRTKITGSVLIRKLFSMKNAKVQCSRLKCKFALQVNFLGYAEHQSK